MTREKKKPNLVLEGFCYGILGTVFTVMVTGMVSVFTNPNYSKSPDSTEINFPAPSPESLTIGLAWLLWGLSISVIFWSVVFRKDVNRSFLKWFLILISASISPILMQVAVLIYLNNNSWKLLGVWSMINLFLILAPFTFLFANRHSIIEKIKNSRP